MENKKNSILYWSYEVPIEEGLYLYCYGDIEVEPNIGPFMLVDESRPFDNGGTDIESGWPVYKKSYLDSWAGGFKFARLLFGIEARFNGEK